MAVLYRPMHIDDVKSLNHVEACANQFVDGGQVVWANYQLLEKDFPHLKNKDDDEIDAWLLQEFSFFSQDQLKVIGRNSPIPTTPVEQTSYRQPTQGRGDLIEAHDDSGAPVGLVDRKGCGVSYEKLQQNLGFHNQVISGLLSQNDFEQKTSTNGLQTLSEAVLETIAAESLTRFFATQNADYPVEMIEHYFIIAFPFDILRGDLTPSVPAIVGRQAHVGRVWLGTNPYRNYSNIKQTDFFGSYTDAGTTRLRIKGVPEFLTGRRGQAEVMKNDFEGHLIKKYRAGDVSIIRSYINENLVRLNHALAEAGLTRKENSYPTGTSVEQALDWICDWICHDPKRYSRFFETLFSLQIIGRGDLLERDSVQAAIHKLLSFSWEDLESADILETVEDGRDLMRPRGLALLQSLINREVQQQMFNSQDSRDREILQIENPTLNDFGRYISENLLKAQSMQS